jgi:hypothetical protein
MTQTTLHNAGVRYSLLFKAFQAGAGVLTIGFIAAYMNPVAQGYYYAFASLIALQSFFELGLFQVVSVSASHEWAHLRLRSDGSIAGNSDAISRLVSLGRFVFKWYGAAASLYLLLAGGLGLKFFFINHSSAIDWTWPWLLHVAFSAGSLWLLPLLSLLEGCNRFESTARFRLLQSLLGSAASWSVLISGGQLWAMPALSGMSLILLLIYLGWSQRHFFSSFWQAPAGEKLSWRYDLFPMQWRLALQGLFSYLSFPLYPALVFSVDGAAAAGRLGMSLQIVSAIQSVALVLLSARAPGFAIAVAQRQHDLLKIQWRRACIQAMLSMTTLSVSFLIVLVLANLFHLPLAHRVLPVSACAMLAAGSVLALVVQCAAVFIRAHKVESLTAVGVISGAAYGITAWVAASSAGAFGVAVSYFSVTALIALPLTGWVFAAARYKGYRQ